MQGLVLSALLARDEALAGTASVFLASVVFATLLGLSLWLAFRGWSQRRQIRRLAQQSADAEALRREHLRLDLALRAGGIGVWEWDARAGRIWLSPEAAAIAGVGPPGAGTQLEVADTVMAEQVVEEDRAEIQRSMLAAFQSGGSYEFEFRHRDQDGRTRWLRHLGVMTAGPSEQGRRLIATVRDVTLEREAVEALARSHADLERVVHERTAELRHAVDELAAARDAAQEAGRAKSVLLANMSHEFRTPLNAVLSMAYVLQRDAPDDVARERARRVERAGRRLLQIVNDLLDLARLESGLGVLQPVDFSVAALLAEVVERHAAWANAKGIDLRVAGVDAPDRLNADAPRLLQALTQVVGNAVKFTLHGAVMLKAESTIQAGQCRLIVLVSDTGGGMPDNVRQRVEQRMPTGEPTLARAHSGLGLGLMLTRRLLEFMGGALDWQTEPGQGTEVRLTIPVRPAARAAAPPALASTQGRHGDGEPAAPALVSSQLPSEAHDRRQAGAPGRPSAAAAAGAASDWDNLNSLLHGGDWRAREVWQRLRGDLTDWPVAAVRAVDDAFERFDLEAAAHLIEQSRTGDARPAQSPAPGASPP